MIVAGITVNEDLTNRLRSYVQSRPELHANSLSRPEIEALDPLTLRRSFYQCPCGQLKLDEQSLLLYEQNREKSAEGWLQLVDRMAMDHRCPSKSAEPVAIQAPVQIHKQRIFGARHKVTPDPTKIIGGNWRAKVAARRAI